MPNDATDPSNPADANEMTLPSRRRLTDSASQMAAARRSAEGSPMQAPPLLLQAFNGEIDLERELARRYPNMPLMTQFHRQMSGSRINRGAAAITPPDGAASLLVEVDSISRLAQFTFAWGGMIGLRFAPARLSDMDRQRWIELMRQPTGEPIYLWGQARWESDYLIFCTRRHFTSVYAFSQHHTEAAVRLTDEVMTALIDLLERLWKPAAPENPALSTW